MDWLPFAVAFGVFFLTHSVPVRPPVKSRLVRILGDRGFTLAYSSLSLVMLAWLIVAAGRAPYVPLWEQASWHRVAALCGMSAVCLLVAFAVGRPNPFSFGGGRAERFDPARPGIVRWSRHPLLLGLALWSGVHLLANGDLAHVILFGTFAGFAILGMRIVDRRKRRLLGDGRWRELREAVSAGPLLSRPLSWSGAVLRAAAGVIGFAVLIALHPVLIGVSPLP